jgi:hypothetical protein
MINSKLYQSNKGISNVVATIIIIVLVIVSIVIIAAVVIPFARNNLDKGTECQPYKDYFTFEERFEIGGETFKYNCYDSASNSYGASIRTKASEQIDRELDAFDLSFIVKGGSSNRVSIRDGEIVENVKMFDGTTQMDVPGLGNVRTYVFTPVDTSLTFEKIEIFPVIQKEEGIRICEITDAIDIKACGSNVNF